MTVVSILLSGSPGKNKIKNQKQMEPTYLRIGKLQYITFSFSIFNTALTHASNIIIKLLKVPSIFIFLSEIKF